MSRRWLVIAAVMSYVIMMLGGAALKPGYSSISQFISELNATGTPFAVAIGWLGFFPFGMVAGALLIASAGSAPVQGASRIGYWLLMAEPVGYIGSAFWPCDAGCPADGSMSQLLHNLLSISTYLATTLGLALLSFNARLAMRWRFFWALLAIAWLILFGLMLDDSLAPWRGILQRLSEWMVYGALGIAAWRIPDNTDSLKPLH